MSASKYIVYVRISLPLFGWVDKCSLSERRSLHIANTRTVAISVDFEIRTRKLKSSVYRKFDEV